MAAPMDFIENLWGQYLKGSSFKPFSVIETFKNEQRFPKSVRSIFEIIISIIMGIKP